MIISGGENVYPAEVEGVLRQHPDVKEACIVGVPDKEWGQRVGALIVSDSPPSPKELIDFGRQYLAGYKLPRLIKNVNRLPRTASGKIERQKAAAELLSYAQQMAEKKQQT